MDSYQKPITIILMFFMDLKEILQETPVGFDGENPKFPVKIFGEIQWRPSWVMFMGILEGWD